MEIGVFGLNHQTAPVAVLEQVAYSEARRVALMLALLDQGLEEVVALSTCGRTEVYYIAPKARLAALSHAVKERLATDSNLANIADYSYEKFGAKALEHMVQVAVGLDSIVLGEDQIIGQMKNAHEAAKSLGCTGRFLNVAFRDAIASAKRIKSELRISEIPLSLSYVGVKAMAAAMGSLKDKSVLVVGLGEMGQLAIANALALGAQVTVTNRSHERIAQLLIQYPEVQQIPYEQHGALLGNYDALITATAAPHLLFFKHQFEGLTQSFVVLDLSLPKDVDDQVATCPLVTLINLDTLAATVEQNKAERLALVNRAHQMVAEHVEKIAQWMEKAHVHYTLKGVGDLLKQSKDDAMAYIDGKVSLDRHQRTLVDKAIEAALKRVVRRPVQMLNQLEDEEERREASRWLHRLLIGDEDTTHM